MRIFASIVFLLYALTATVIASASKSNVLDLTKSADFDAAIGGKQGALVEFFAPWCGHCKKLAPTFDELADVFASRKNELLIAKVDADNNRELGQRFGVRGFPTLMWFKPNSLEPETYSGPRDLKSLQAFVEEQSGQRAQVKPKLPSKAVQLDASNFDAVVLDASKDVFVEFYAPWCGFCKKIAPVVETVAATYENEDGCIVAQMDADNAENRKILAAHDIEVQAYPTFKFFGRSSKSTPDKFEQTADPQETEAKMIDYINARCFTHRALGGGLTELAGRMPLLDTLASRFFMASKADEKAGVLEETRSYVERMRQSVNATEAKNEAAAYYIKVMDKMMGESTYLDKESKRLQSLIKKHVEGTSQLASRKYDDFKRRANILSSFAKREMSDKAREAADKAIKGASSIKDEL